MNPLLLAQLGLGAGQSLAGVYQALNAKSADYSALDKSIAEKERTRNRLLGTYNRASEEGRRGFNPTDLSRMTQGAQNAATVYNANMGGGSLAQRMGGLLQGAQQYTGNMADIGAKNTLKQQENMRYADQALAGLGQAEKNVSDAGLDKMEVMNKISAAQKAAGWGAFGSGLTSIMGGLGSYQRGVEAKDQQKNLMDWYDKNYGKAGGEQGGGSTAILGSGPDTPPDETSSFVSPLMKNVGGGPPAYRGPFTPENMAPPITYNVSPEIPNQQSNPYTGQSFDPYQPPSMGGIGYDPSMNPMFMQSQQGGVTGVGDSTPPQPNQTQLSAILANPQLKALLQTNPNLLEQLFGQTKNYGNQNNYASQIGY